MAKKYEGRDVFVAGVDTTDGVKGIFASTFALRADQMFVEGQPQDSYLAALRSGSLISIYELDSRGTFRFKVEMEFTPSIDPAKFLYAARRYDVAIAYAVDEDRTDFAYHIATKDGIKIGQLSFIEVGGLYICNIV